MLNKGFFFLLLIFSNFLSWAQLDTIIELEEVIIVPQEKYLQEVLIDNSSLSLAQQLIDKSPVFIKEYGAGNLATITYQGTTSSQSALYWNGINLNPINSGTVDYSLIDSYLFESFTLNTSTNNLQGIAIGANITLEDSKNETEGIKMNALLRAGTFNDLNLGAKVLFKDSLNLIKFSTYAGVEENDFTFFNPITKEYQRQENNRNEHLAGLFLWERQLKDGMFYFRSWNRISDREIPSPVHVAELGETQKDFHTRNVVGYHKYFDSSWLKAQVAYLNEKYEYNNPKSSIKGEGGINRVQSNVTYNLEADKYKFTSSGFIDFQRGRISGDLHNRNLLGASFLGSYSLGYGLDVSASLRKEWFLQESNLPLLWETKLEHRLKHLISYVSLQKNARKPTLNDLFWPEGGNENLESEISNTLYIGLKTNRIIDTKFEFFYGNISNLIIWLPDPNSGRWTPQNEESLDRRGFTLDLSKNLTIRKIKVKPTLVYTHTISETSEEKQLIYTPRNQLKWALDLSLNEKMFVKYSGQWVSKSYAARDHSFSLPAYTVSNLQLSKFWGTKKRFKTSVESRNLFGYTYYIIPFRPLPRRYIGLKLELI